MNESKRKAEQKVIEAITEYIALQTGMNLETVKDFKLKDGYPRLEYENGIYENQIRLEVLLGRQPL